MYVCFKCLLVTNWAVHSLCASLSLCCGIVYIVDAHCHVVELEMGELLTNSPISTVVLCLSVCRVRFVHEFESADEYQEGKRGLHPEQHTHTPHTHHTYTAHTHAHTHTRTHTHHTHTLRAHTHHTHKYTAHTHTHHTHT